jgi:hypothetical protein
MAKGFGQEIQKQSTRVSQLKKKLNGSEDADLIMMNILEIFKEIEYVPDPGKYYTFIYIPKTPDITYDEHPLVAVTEVQKWGFRGFNYHWRMMRNYTWIEVVGALHTIEKNEIDYLRSLPFGKIKTK